MDADVTPNREEYRSARVMEYGSFAMGLPASYLALAGEWTATLTALALGAAVYAMSHVERVAAATRRRRAVEEDP